MQDIKAKLQKYRLRTVSTLEEELGCLVTDEARSACYKDTHLHGPIIPACPLAGLDHPTLSEGDRDYLEAE